MATVKRISRFRHKIALQSRATALDELGRQTRAGGSWTTYATPWAEVLELSGREMEVARQKVADATHAVSIRYRTGITTEHRIEFRGRVLEIRSGLDGDSSQRELVLVCGELR